MDKGRKYFKYLDVRKESGHNMLFFEISFGKRKDTFKMPIDNTTAIALRPVLKMKPFKETSASIYEYINAGSECDKTNNLYHVYVEVASKRMRLKQKVKCSKTFYQNLLWIMECENFDEYYEHLEKA